MSLLLRAMVVLGVSTLVVRAAADGDGPAASSAQDQRSACIQTAENGQKLLKDRKLMEAREALSQCSTDACPPLLRRDCTGWLEQVRGSLPSVIVSAKDGSGHDLAEGGVTLDGHALGAALDGKSHELDPGRHVLRLERLAKPAVEVTFVAREGEQGRVILLQEPRPMEPARVASKGHNVAAVVLVSLGVVAAGVFAVAGIKGITDRSSLCLGSHCTPDANNQISTEFVVADVGGGVAIAAVVGAAIAFFTRYPSSAATHAPSRQALAWAF